MDLAVRCSRKAGKLNHSLTHSRHFTCSMQVFIDWIHSAAVISDRKPSIIWWINVYFISFYLIFLSNAIGPVVSIWLVATTQSLSGSASSPIWILLLGGAGISVGLWVWGRRVIETMGEDLTAVTPSRWVHLRTGGDDAVLIGVHDLIVSGYRFRW